MRTKGTCEHETVGFEYDDADPKGTWVRAVCATCGEKGEWMLSKLSAISALDIGSPFHLAWAEEEEKNG